MCMKVDLPDPDGPVTATNSPGSTSRFTPRNACTFTSPTTYVFMRSWTEMTGMAASPHPRHAAGRPAAAASAGFPSHRPRSPRAAARGDAGDEFCAGLQVVAEQFGVRAVRDAQPHLDGLELVRVEPRAARDSVVWSGPNSASMVSSGAATAVARRGGEERSRRALAAACRTAVPSWPRARIRSMRLPGLPGTGFCIRSASLRRPLRRRRGRAVAARPPAPGRHDLDRLRPPGAAPRPAAARGRLRRAGTVARLRSPRPPGRAWRDVPAAGRRLARARARVAAPVRRRRPFVALGRALRRPPCRRCVGGLGRRLAERRENIGRRTETQRRIGHPQDVAAPRDLDLDVRRHAGLQLEVRIGHSMTVA